MAEKSTTPLLEMRHISKRFGAVQALTDVHFDLFPGEVVGLVGDNGAGKSTLIKIVSGIYGADEGQILFEGRTVSVRSPQDAGRIGIATVYQDLALCDNLDVVANLFLGRENVFDPVAGPLASLDEVLMERRAVDVLELLAVRIPSVRTPVASLSGGQRQSVAVARSVMWNSKVVILDEPTAALGVAQTAQVLELILRLRAQGLGVVVISHNLANIFGVCDRISVLYLGRSTITLDRRSSTSDQVITAITGAQFGGTAGVIAADATASA